MKISFTVIIAACNRPEMLRVALGYCQRAILSTEQQCKVVVVDNGDSSLVKDLVVEFTRDAEVDVSRRVSEPRNKAVALNVGIKNADTEWLAFTDDDALPDEDWLVNAVQYIDSNPEISVFGGRIVPELGEIRLPLWLKGGEVWRSLPGPAVVSYEPMDQSGILEGQMPVPLGANFFARKSVFEKHGDYDEKLWQRCGNAALGSEDAEFGMRVREKGEKIGYCREAIVKHPVYEEKVTLGRYLKFNYYSGIRESILFGNQPSAGSVGASVRSAVGSMFRSLVNLVKGDLVSGVREALRASFSLGMIAGRKR